MLGIVKKDLRYLFNTCYAMIFILFWFIFTSCGHSSYRKVGILPGDTCYTEGSAPWWGWPVPSLATPHLAGTCRIWMRTSGSWWRWSSRRPMSWRRVWVGVERVGVPLAESSYFTIFACCRETLSAFLLALSAKIIHKVTDSSALYHLVQHF